MFLLLLTDLQVNGQLFTTDSLTNGQSFFSDINVMYEDNEVLVTRDGQYPRKSEITFCILLILRMREVDKSKLQLLFQTSRLMVQIELVGMNNTTLM